ncbi:hypothetical protein [Nostoc sp. KVJ20]|nr:hypothetical protein [Nostoc sp. KVJ20]
MNLSIPSGEAPNVANAALTAVAHGGNPHRPWRLPLGEDRAASPKSKI